MNFTKNTIAVLFMFFLAQLAFAADAYKLDPNHTYATWHVNHFGFSELTGKWMAEGNLILDKEKPENSKVNVTIQVANFNTGIPKLDEHLASDDFFDVKKFPTATFVSDKVDVTGSTTAKVHGILTVHGVSKPVTLDVTLNKEGEHPMNQKLTAGFSATTELKRSDFGVGKYAPNVGDEVKITITAEAEKLETDKMKISQ
jgi:polyisoprenoid-binding protein YceI